MTDRPTNEEREALIAGDQAGALEPDEAAELALMADLLAHPSTWVEPDAALEDAIVRAVVGGEPDLTVAPAATPFRHRAASRRRRLVLSALASAAAIAILIGAVVAARGGTGTDFTSRLSATALAPGARGSAGITHNRAGFRISLVTHGLAPLPRGEYYHAWLKNAAGTLVPIGTFSSSDDRITLWSGVSPQDFSTITVTIEAADNDQTSSGRRVLVGDVRAS